MAKINRDNSYLLGNTFAQGHKPNATSFQKGSVPWNKGLSVRLSPTTEFKKGQRSLRRKPLHTISIRRERSGTLRQWIKIREPNVWVEYAKYLWAKTGAQLPDGFVLHHINNNSLDDRIENLILVTRSDHAKLHNRWNTKNVKAPKR